MYYYYVLFLLRLYFLQVVIDWNNWSQ